jgi:hypothetical protein
LDVTSRLLGAIPNVQVIGAPKTTWFGMCDLRSV